MYNTSGVDAGDIPAGTVFTWGDYFNPKTDGLIITPPNNVGLEKVVVATIE